MPKVKQRIVAELGLALRIQVFGFLAPGSFTTAHLTQRSATGPTDEANQAQILYAILLKTTERNLQKVN